MSISKIKLTVFPGCFALTKQLAVTISTLKVLQYLNVEVEIPRNINCCGFAFRSIYPLTSMYLTSRLLATLYNPDSIGILTLCNGCYLMLREIVAKLRSDPKLWNSIKINLKEEGIEIADIPRIVHPVELFHDLIGVKILKSIAVENRYRNVIVATHYGCHALRPSDIPSFDNTVNPNKMEKIIESLGFITKDYPERLDCCGATLLASNPKLAMKLAYNKIRRTLDWGFNLLVTTCPYCFEMLDSKQEAIANMFGDEPRMPVMLLTQLIGLHLGLDEHDLAIHFNLSPIDRILPHIVKR